MAVIGVAEWRGARAELDAGDQVLLSIVNSTALFCAPDHSGRGCPGQR